jgi:uncharacterized protein (DUF1778 family)
MKPRSSVVQVRVTPEQKATIEAAAAAVGLKLSDWVRAVLLFNARGMRTP